MIWNKIRVQFQRKDRMRARKSAPLFLKKVSNGDIPSPLRDDLHLIRCNDLLLSIFPALGFVYYPRLYSDRHKRASAEIVLDLFGTSDLIASTGTYRLTYRYDRNANKWGSLLPTTSERSTVAFGHRRSRKRTTPPTPDETPLHACRHHVSSYCLISVTTAVTMSL